MAKKRTRYSHGNGIPFAGLILISLIMLTATSCSSEDRIKKEIDAANYCSSDNDCTDIGGKCPFGCYVLVNKAESERIASLVDRFDSSCVYGCVAISGIRCSEGRCVTVLREGDTDEMPAEYSVTLKVSSWWTGWSRNITLSHEGDVEVVEAAPYGGNVSRQSFRYTGDDLETVAGIVLSEDVSGWEDEYVCDDGCAADAAHHMLELVRDGKSKRIGYQAGSDIPSSASILVSALIGIADSHARGSLCVGEGEGYEANEDLRCCDGLRPEWDIKAGEDGKCLPTSLDGSDGLICIDCGDGTCGPHENGCSCPEDCQALGWGDINGSDSALEDEG